MDLPREITFSKTRAPAVAAALRLASRERIAECVRHAHRIGIRLPMPTVSFDLRGTTAGQAYRTENHVRLNAVLLTENACEFIKQTIGHEVAHLAAHFRHGESIEPHGPGWQAIMVAFGLEPRRCHNFDTANAAVSKTYPFICGCATPHQLSVRRYRKGLQGRYKCLKCNQTLRPADEAGQPISHPATAPKAPMRTPSPPAPRRPLPSTPPARLPTEAMMRYARDLASRTGLSLPAAALIDVAACSRFIEQAKLVQIPARPTERQLAFAQQLAAKRGLRIPPAALASRTVMSDWLDATLAR